MAEVHHSVGIFPVNARGELLLQLRDDRPDLNDPATWTTLGGGIERGETPEQAARRELVEECGRAPEYLAAIDVTDRVRPDGYTLRVHGFAAAVDWSLDDLILGEGQALAWFHPRALEGLRLNSLIGREMLAFAASPVRGQLATAAPPFRESRLRPLPSGIIHELGITPTSLVALHGATAAFANRLRAALPGGARLTASPAPYEQPDLILWWPGGMPDPARAAELEAGLTAGGRLRVIEDPMWPDE